MADVKDFSDAGRPWYNSGDGPALLRKPVLAGGLVFPMSILSVVGGQYGSEGKGVIVAALSDGVTLAVRTGGPNAGHSLIHDGRVWKMRSIPCSWINPKAMLVIGPGAVLNVELLIHEVEEIEAAGYNIRDRLMVDPRATLTMHADEVTEQGRLVNTIGSTGEGVGEARVRKVRRDPKNWITADQVFKEHGILVRDTLPVVNMHAIAGALLLEGTQGYGLSLSLGRWPYVTSANCTAAQLLSDAGVGLVGVFETMIVFRSYPIRVGGHSGAFPNELTWDEMSARLGHPITPERTTVTNRIRRIGEFDWELSREAVMANGATVQVLTFADYIDPACAGVTSWFGLSRPIRAFIDRLEESHGIPVVLVGTGGPNWSVIAAPASPTLHRGGPKLGQDILSN